MQKSNGQQQRSAYKLLWRNRSFTALWIGQAVSFVGDYFYWLAIPIMVERLTGSTLMVGLSVIATALPTLLLGPIAGVFVDRWDRKKTMVVSDVLRALLVLLCLFVQRPEQVWIYYVVGFLMACVSRFFFPAQNAALPLIVSDDTLLAANGLMQIVQTAGLLVGPALAGFAIGLWGERVAFVFDSATFVFSALAIATITVPRTTAARQERNGRLGVMWEEMRSGVVYLFTNRTMVGVVICLAVVQLGVGAINVVWVPFLKRTFGVGPEGLGIVDSAQGVGMVVGGFLLGFLNARLSKSAIAGWGIALVGVVIAGMGMVNQFLQVVVLVFGIGLVLTPIQSALMTMMQLAVPDLKRGRVGSAMNAVTMAAGLLSMAAASGFSEQIGLRMVYVISGVINVGAGILGLVILRDP